MIIGLSARMLVQSAGRGGFTPFAVDLFGDEDTRAMAADWQPANATADGLRTTSLLDAVDTMGLPPGTGLVYGSGLEACPGVLARLGLKYRLLGNPPDLLLKLRSPQFFFGMLRELAIPFPEVRFGAPANPLGWLRKEAGSSGGQGVRWAGTGSAAGPSIYYQRLIPGRALSCLFLADGARARIVGFNHQWSRAETGRPFLFAGVMSGADWVESVAGHIARLVPALGLRGLNSLDFLGAADGCRVLELNPRPSASMALYEDDFPDGLLAAHIRALAGQLPQSPVAGPVRALQIVYAETGLVVPESWRWPEWVSDRPSPGTRIPASAPVCSISAEAADGAGAKALLVRRERFLRRRWRGNSEWRHNSIDQATS